MEAGINAYLTKPFSAKELVSTVRGLMRIQETSAELVLTRSMDSLQTIAGGLAHEINNPLNYMKSALSLIQTDSEQLQVMLQDRTAGEAPSARTNDIMVRMARMFQVAETGLRRIGSTVELMQRYSRDGYTRAIQAFDVFESMRDVASMLQAGMEKPVIEMSLEGSGEIECVPEEFTQVLTNLVQNAIDALPANDAGRILIKTRNEDDFLVLSIKDNGCGISAEHRSKIFTPFFTTKDVGKGMGLGLSIVWRVVTSLGGTVHVTSQPGAGTEFAIRVPRAPGSAASGIQRATA
jgi:signal transduction histidine kinase